MRTSKWLALFLLLALSVAAQAAPTVYNLYQIKLTNGWVLTGTVTTDGTVGPLTATNIIDWNLKLVQITDQVWTEKNSNDLNISGVSTDGQRLYVASSPDGIQDGGTLYFSIPRSPWSIPTNAVIADFTQLGQNLGFGMGGIAGWQDELGGLNYVGLNIRNAVKYRAGSIKPRVPNTFQVTVPILATNPIEMTMFGSITTDGTLGMLLPQNIIAWNITARNRDIRYYNKTNSTVLYATGLTTDGSLMKVAHAAGQLVIGIGGMRPTFVTLADFTDSNQPNGFVNYYVGNYGVMGEKYPLVPAKALWYTVAKHPLP